jgi:peptide/nickel transport system permease protein
MNIDSPFHQAFKRFKKNGPALAGVVFIAFLILVALGGAAIRPDSSRDANNQHLSIARQKPGFHVDIIHLTDGSEVPISHFEQKDGEVLYTPFGETADRAISADDADFKVEHRRYLLGTDKYGRDLLSRLMAGTGLSLSVGFIAVLISLLLGIVLGACAGYFGGKTDAVISWVINVVWSIPTLLMVIAITLAFGKGFWQVFVAVGLTMWVEVARVVRGQFLSIREKEYVEAAKMLGLSNFRIMFRHILPNASGPIIVISAANFASAILIEAGLSFLGIGAQIPTPSWGNMIKEHYALITTDLAYLAILPGLLIMLLVLSFMMIGNGLRDALDVRS